MGIHNHMAFALKDWGRGHLYLVQDTCIRTKRFDVKLWGEIFSAQYEYCMRWVDLRIVESAQTQQNIRSLTTDFQDVWTVSLGFVLDDRERAERLAQIFLTGYRLHWVRDITESPNSPCVCALQILAQFLGEPPLVPDKNYRPHAIYDALFTHWRNPDFAVLTPILLAACDEHTWRVQGRKDGSFYRGKEFWQYGQLPLEILMIFRLREYMGLPNPVLDHPLMNTALGKLPTETVPYAHHEVIGPVVARMRREGYDDTTVLQRLRDAGERMGPRED